MKCGDKCLPEDCNSNNGNFAVSEACFTCLESCTAAKCQSCKPGDTCLSAERVGRCRICILNIYYGMVKCGGQSSPLDINNCVLASVYSHCRPCVCWAVCLFGMTSSCNCCRYGRCWCFNYPGNFFVCLDICANIYLTFKNSNQQCIVTNWKQAEINHMIIGIYRKRDEILYGKI